MPRYPRTFISGFAHHVLQRGLDRKTVFAAAEDYRFYLENLSEQKRRLDIDVLAYCLMTNHVHLLLRPRSHSNSLSELMRVLAARYTRHANKIEGRRGTLWDGRFKCSVIDTEAYLMACCRYVDLNPVRARIAANPEDYAWSSYRALAGFGPGNFVDRDALYRLLDLDPGQAGAVYRAFVQEGVGDDELTLIREAVQRNQLTGSGGFVDLVETKIGRRIEARGRGRPRHRPKI